MQLNLRGALKSPDETHRSIRTPTTSIAYKPLKRSEVLPASNSLKKIVYYQAPALYEKTPATTTTTSLIGSSNNRDMSSSTSTSSSSSFVEERQQFARENPSLLEPLLPHNSEQETLSSSSSPPAYSTFTTTTPTSSTIKERLSPQEKISPELKEQTPPQSEEQQLSTSSQSWSGEATESFKSIPATGGSYSAPSSPVRSIHRQVLNILGKGKVLPSTARRTEQSRTELFSAIREQGQRRSRKQLFAELREKRNVQLRNKLFNEIRERRVVQQRNKLFSEIRDRKMTEMRNMLFAEIRNRQINQLRKAMLAEIRDRRATQLRNKLFSEIRDRRTTQLRNQLFSEIRDRRMTQMRNKLFSDIRDRRATQLRNKLFSEIRERNTNQLRKAMLAEIRDRRAAQLREKLFAEIRDRRAMQLREKLFAEIRDRKTNQLHDKLLSEIRDWKTTQLRQKLFSEIRERKTVQLRNELLSEIRERKTAMLREKLFSDIRNRKTDQLRKSLLAEIQERKGSNLPSALRQQRALLFAEILQRKVFTSPRTQRLRSALFKEIIERQPFEPASPHTSKLREELFKEIRQRNPVGSFKSIPASASGGSYSAPSSPVRSIHRKVLNILGKGKVLPSEARRMERGESWSQTEPEVTFIITMEPTRTTEMIEKEAPAIRPKHQMRRASHPAVHPIRKKFIEPMLLAEKEEEERLAKLEEDRSTFLRSQTSTSSSAFQLPEPVQPSAPIQAPFEAVQNQLSEPIQTPSVQSIETTSSVLPEEKSLPLMPEVPETIPTAAVGQTESISGSQKDIRSMYNLPAQESTVSIRRNSITQIPSTSGTSTPLNMAQATPHQLPPVYEPGYSAAETVTTAAPVSSISPTTPEIDIEAGVNVVPIVAPIIPSPASQSNVETISSISEEPISSRATSFIAPTSLNAPVGVHELTKLPQADQYDVIIVGGGLSGLAAAYKLTSMVDLGITPRVLLLESSNRLGGRLETMPLANTQELLDLGAMWIPGEHQTVWKLAAELGLEYYPNMQMGSNILQHGNKLKMFNGALSEAFHAFGKKNTNSLFTKINKIAQSMSEHHPFLEKNSVNYDKLSVYAWSRKEAWSKETTEALDLMVESIFGCKSTDISMLYFLYNIRTCNVDIRRLWQIAVGYQCYRLSGGIQALTDGLAQKITAAGVKTVLNVNVLSIVQQNENNMSATEEFTSAIVSTSQGTFYGKNVIFAASPKATASIEFSPPLPPIRQQLPQRLHTNRWIRAFAVYDAPFWRESGYSGQVFIYSSLIDREPISFVYEASTMSGLKSGSYVLCASIVGERAAYWGAKSPNDRRIAVLSKLGSLFGPRALQAKYFVDQDWGKDQYARGGSFTVFPPGAMSACFGGIKQPHYQIHWAATETANEWQGYIEGACQSGFRAATEVADRLAHQLILEKAPIVSASQTTTVEETTTASVASLGQLKPTGGFSNIPIIAPNVVTMNQR